MGSSSCVRNGVSRASSCPDIEGITTISSNCASTSVPSSVLAKVRFFSELDGRKSNPHPDGHYSRKAVALGNQLAGKQIPNTVHSPDGLSKVTAAYFESRGEDHVSLSVRGRIGILNLNLGSGVAAEVLRAADSLCNTSDEGANGLYKLILVGRLATAYKAKM